jgi:hypothetical protein
VAEVREPEALHSYVLSIATDVLSEQLSPLEGANLLVRLWFECDSLARVLATFTELAPAHVGVPPDRDSPPNRREREREIVIEMERLRRRFGS